MSAIDPVDAEAAARLHYYGLSVQPFQPTADPEFLWLGEPYREVLAALKAGVLDNAGLVLLTGDIGTGKTTLAHALEESLGDGASIARLDYPGLEPPDFFKVVATAYGLGEGIASREAFVGRLVPFLIQARARGRRVLLILDEAQSLGRELLDELGHLAALEHESARLLNILLVGQNELGAIVVGPQHRDLGQRIAARYRVEPLTMREIDEYIRHRLTVAGTTRSPFGADAVREISALSRGVPRLVNLIADLALLRGFQAKAQTITSGIIAECARDLSPWDLGERRWRRRRYAMPAAGTRRATLLRRHRRAVALAVLLVLVAVVGGYLYAQGWLGARREYPAIATPPSATPPGRPSLATDDQSGAAPPRAVESEPPAPEKGDRETAPPAPAEATASRPPSKQGAAAPSGKSVDASRASPTIPALASPPARATPPAREGGAAPRAPSDAATKSPARPRATPPADDTARERADPDPNAIIDWLLHKSPTSGE